jgi:thiamine transport system substrate-binding protein
VLKSSKNKELAKKFLTFMHSEIFADIIPTTNWAYPVVRTKKSLPAAFDTLTIPKEMLLVDGEIVAKNRKAIINEWLKALER